MSSRPEWTNRAVIASQARTALKPAQAPRGTADWERRMEGRHPPLPRMCDFLSVVQFAGLR